jgi:hypothetical protein
MTDVVVEQGDDGVEVALLPGPQVALEQRPIDRARLG